MIDPETFVSATNEVVVEMSIKDIIDRLYSKKYSKF